MSSTRTQNPQQDLQNVAVILHFTSGDFNQGFNISLRINNNGICEHQENFREKLPSAPEIPPSYQEWAKKYEDMGLDWSDITPVDGVRTNEANFDSCTTAASTVQQKLSEWFESREFSFLSAHIQSFDLVKRDKSVPIVFNFDTSNVEVNEQLRKLPWHQWSLFKKLRQAEVAISLGPRRPSPQIGSPVRILAVFGSDQGGLSLQEDEESLEDILKHKSAEIVFLPKPTAEELNQNLYDSKGWDILFFTGHSSSDLEDGKLLLSKDHSVSLSVFEDAFRFAIQKGLKIAIFNSCKGLGIANFFSGWNGNNRFPNLPLPSIIVMREQVPDFVARRFFREFLHQFTSGEPIYRAVREARNRLSFLDGERVDQDRKKQPYPCASWIPVVCLNPNQPEISWPQPQKGPIQPSKRKLTRPAGGSKIGKWIGVGGGIAAAALIGWVAVKYFLGGSDTTQIALEPGLSLESENISLGEDLIIPPQAWTIDDAYSACVENISLKESGIERFEAEEWSAAIQRFEEFRSTCQLDPETLIYLNNAKTLAQSGSDTIRVAVVVPARGVQTFGLAQEILRGPAQVQNAINQSGGIAGRLLQIQIVNDTSNNSTDAGDLTVDVAEALRDDPAVVAVVGSYTSADTKEAVDIYAEEGLLTISGTSTAVRDGDFPLNEEFALRTSPTDAEAAEDFASIIQEQGYKKVGIVYQSNDAYSRSLKQQSVEALEAIGLEEGLSIIAPPTCDLGTIEFSAELCINRDLDGVEAILLLPNIDHKDKFVQAVQKIADLSEKPALFGGDAVFSGATLREIGQEVEGILVSIPWHQSLDIDQDDAFLSQAQSVWGTGSINWRTALAYDAAKAIIGAANQMSSGISDQDDDGIITREEIPGIQAEVKNGSFEGFLGAGTIKFDDRGDRELSSNSGLGTIVQVQCEATDEGETRCGYGKPEIETSQ